MPFVYFLFVKYTLNNESSSTNNAILETNKHNPDSQVFLHSSISNDLKYNGYRLFNNRYDNEIDLATHNAPLYIIYE